MEYWERFPHGERIAVRRIIRHQYNRKTRENDLALLELAAEPKWSQLLTDKQRQKSLSVVE